MRITARGVPYSSIVGAGVLLADESGAVIGQLAMLNVAGGRDEAEALRDRAVAAINAGQAERQVRHFKNGRTYDVIAEKALFQISITQVRRHGGAPTRWVSDGDPVTVYRNEHGTFVRFPDEMVAPRFEEVQS
jgi:hypothetical protein